MSYQPGYRIFGGMAFAEFIQLQNLSVAGNSSFSTTVNLGEPAGRRKIVVASVWSPQRSLSGMTLGGQAMAVHGTLNLTSPAVPIQPYRCSFMSVDFPEGETATLAASFNDFLNRADILVFRVAGAKALVDDDFRTATSVTSQTRTADVPSRGAAIAAMMQISGESNNWAISAGATQQHNQTLPDNHRRIAGAFNAENQAFPDHDIAFNRISGSTTSTGFWLAASFR